MKRKRRRIKWKNVIIALIMLICIITLCISIINIIKWKKDSNKTNNQIDKIQEVTSINEVKDTEDIEIIEQEEEIEETDPYWDYIKMNLIDVDFTELKLINNQTKGWIQVSGTNINYPFVQTKDNDYYLTHSFDKSYNGAGWVFLDYRNNIDNMDKNTIIYAHGRYDNTMFGTLLKTLDKIWFNNTENYIVKLSTEKENTLWQVFSIYRIPNTNDYIQTEFYNEEEFENFANMLLDRSIHNFNTNISKNDNILTLSTCYNDDEKVVLHAKLIKRSLR